MVECVGGAEVLGVEGRSDDEVEAVKAACIGFPAGTCSSSKQTS